MNKVGEIKEIWRYPVKGMAGERISMANLDDKGLAGDRLWAVRDIARREIQSCKFRPELLQCSARTGHSTTHDVEIEFPDGEVLLGSDVRVQERVSNLIGHASTLERLDIRADLEFYRRHKRDDHSWLAELKQTFDREAGEPLPPMFNDVPAAAADFVVMPGTFFLVTPFHLLTTSTLRWLASIDPQSDWDVRRFRPNLVIDTAKGVEGLIEQEWIGKMMSVGDATLHCNDTTPRCGAVTRSQRSLPVNTSILRTVVKHADQNVGIYGMPSTPGPFKEGDAVYVGSGTR